MKTKSCEFLENLHSIKARTVHEWRTINGTVGVYRDLDNNDYYTLVWSNDSHADLAYNADAYSYAYTFAKAIADYSLATKVV